MWLVRKIKAFLSRKPEVASRRRETVLPWPERYYINSAVIEKTYAHLKREGMKPTEGLVYWAGWYLNNVCLVTSLLVPSGFSRYGGVCVPTQEMVRIARLMRGFDLFIVAQVHTHPGDHGHSGGDDVNAVSSVPGFLSIVVPNFAQAATLRLEDCYLHRYLGKGRWRELPSAESKRLIQVDPLEIG